MRLPPSMQMLTGRHSRVGRLCVHASSRTYVKVVFFPALSKVLKSRDTQWHVSLSPLALMHQDLVPAASTSSVRMSTQ